jgi:hypothetical protein
VRDRARTGPDVGRFLVRGEGLESPAAHRRIHPHRAGRLAGILGKTSRGLVVKALAGGKIRASRARNHRPFARSDRSLNRSTAQRVQTTHAGTLQDLLGVARIVGKKDIGPRARSGGTAGWGHARRLVA